MNQDFKKIANENIGLAYSLSNKWYKILKSQGIEFDDILSLAFIGLMKAARTFEKERGNTFSTYGCACIENEIKMYLRKENNRRSISINLSDLTGKSSDEDITTKKKRDYIQDTLFSETPLNEFVDHLYLEALLDKLKENMNCYDKNKNRNKQIFTLYYLKDLSQKEIAEKFNMSQSYISRIIRRIKNNIQEYSA